MAASSCGGFKVFMKDVPDRFDKFLLEDAVGAAFWLEGKIEDIERQSDGTTVVTFENQKDAENAVKTGLIKFDDGGITVLAHSNKTKEVILQGVPTSSSEMKLRYFFQSKMKSPVESVQIFQDKCSALITFKEYSDAERIVNMKNLELPNGENVKPKFYRISPEETKQQRSVYFSGITKDFEDKEYFKFVINEMLGEDVEIDDIRILKDKKAAIVVFCDVKSW